MVTIFINNNPIYLTNDLKFSSKTNFFYIDKIEIETLVTKLEIGEFKSLYIYDEDGNRLLEKFKNNFNIIEAAGGVVENSKCDILFIYRNGKWDLPKGKIELGETMHEAALREVKEECGISLLELNERLIDTYHIYKIKQEYILKITHWFKMSSNYKGSFQPQIEEGITKVTWISRQELSTVEANTYENIALCIKETI